MPLTLTPSLALLTCVLARLLGPVHEARSAISLHLRGGTLSGRDPRVHPERLVVALVAAPVGGGGAGRVRHLAVRVVRLRGTQQTASAPTAMWHHGRFTHAGLSCRVITTAEIGQNRLSNALLCQIFANFGEN